ncbi:MAG: DUF4124 domain-containing protein [Nitrosomonas sp.]|nr:DUF4124 domain-containing protein [Nitrosomonas sp.]
MRYLVAMILFMSCHLPVHAQIYKWIDENGKTQYADQPPISGKVRNEQRLRINSAPIPVSFSGTEGEEDPAKLKTSGDEKSEYEKRRQERQQKEIEKKATIAENKQKCIDAQSRLRLFLESPRLRVPDGEGGLTYVDDNVREQKINEANQAVTTYCK